jgi:hypothetical protein
MATGEWSSQFNPLSVWGNGYHTQIFYLNHFLDVADRRGMELGKSERNELFKKRLKVKHTLTEPGTI